MSDSNTDIQKQIETIDIELYNLLMRRTELVKQQPELMKIENIPGQEALGVRRILRYHDGDFPKDMVAKIWREIVCVSASLNQRLRVAVFGEDSNDSLIRCVHEHFGSYIDFDVFGSFNQVFNEVSSGEARFAVIPCDNHEMNLKPWWMSLASNPAGAGLNIVAKLPFLRSKNSIPEEEVYIVAPSPTNPCGNDNSLLGIETDEDVSSSSICEILTSLGFNGVKVLLSTSVENAKFSLVDVKGYIKAGDKRLQDISEMFKNLNLVGVYANPIEL